MNNTPTLMQSEEKEAPWNEKTKLVDVDISVSMSAHYQVEVPEDFDETDNIALEEVVKEQIYLPQDLIDDKILSDKWIVDEFCVL